MFIGKDSSKQFLLAAYWEDGMLILVVKDILPNGTLRQHSAISYAPADAEILMISLKAGTSKLQGVTVDLLTATAVAGRIAEGLRRSNSGKELAGNTLDHQPRISPELWN
ncbi:MAG: hypothetical protein WBH28_02315 [Fuerstiella sp.]